MISLSIAPQIRPSSLPLRSGRLSGCGVCDAHGTDRSRMIDLACGRAHIEDHGTEVRLSGPDVAAQPLQLHGRGAWPVIPTQQEHFEHAGVIRLDRREHQDFDHTSAPARGIIASSTTVQTKTVHRKRRPPLV